MIKKIELIRFKKYMAKTFVLKSDGVTLLVGGNNAGKSTLIHALAVWEFCKVILLHEKGRSVFSSSALGKSEGFGMSAEEFLPIAVPSLNHLWTNLKTQLSPKEKEEWPDQYSGYIMRIKCTWDYQDATDKMLEIGLSLVNDRLFIRVTNSNLVDGDYLPTIVYLPTFAGVLPKENKVTVAERRAYLGKGMAGSIIRNMIYDLYLEDKSIKAELLQGKNRLGDTQKRELQERSPLQKLQQNLRTTFFSELEIEPFSEEFHTVLRVNERKVVKREDGNIEVLPKSKYTPRDIITQGSGFLQWLSIFAIMYSSSIDILLLDEPDAHLHASLQSELLNRLCAIAEDKQILISTHSVEMIRQAPLKMIYSMDKCGYLEEETARAGALTGIGSEYFPKIDLLKRYKNLIFIENESDKNVLNIMGTLCGNELPSNIVYWANTYSHQERKKIFIELQKYIPDLKCISLRDRDSDDIKDIAENLNKRSVFPGQGSPILLLEWRRRNIESYFLCPRAIADAAGKTLDAVKQHIQTSFALAITDSGFTDTNAPEPILACDGKKIFTDRTNGIEKIFGVDKYKVAQHMKDNEVCDDIKTFLTRVNTHFTS